MYGLGFTGEVDDLQLLVDDDARWRVLVEEQTLDVLLELAGTVRPGRLGCRGTPQAPHIDPPARDQAAPRDGTSCPRQMHLVRAVHRCEQIRGGPDAFRAAEDQRAGRLQGVVKDLKDLLLRGRFEIDQHVATRDQIHVREGRILGQIVFGEHTQVANALGDLVLAVDGCEEPLAARDRHLACAGFGVDAGARFLYGGVVDVRAENVNGRALAAILEKLDEGDGQRVRFFPG